jgi:hypothetical protein
MPDKGSVEGPWLSPEDERLLKLLAEDRTTREIADELGVSPSQSGAELSPSSTRWGCQRGWASPRSMPSPLIDFPAHALLILEERLAEQEAEGVEMPAGIERDELALTILIAASRPSLRQSPLTFVTAGAGPSWKRGTSR